jgi:hypothetical protein
MTRTNGWRGSMPRAAARRLARSDESGATLIFALIFITVVSVIVAAVLSFVDTSMRTTLAVRRQAATAAAADGAAQVAINHVRTNDYIVGHGGTCVDGLSFPPTFYQQGGTSYSAAVTCDIDTSDSVLGGGGGRPITSSNRPGQAILTLGRGANDGLEVLPRGNQVMKVRGEVYSNSYITVEKYLTVQGGGDIRAVGTCTALSGGAIVSDGGTVQCRLGGSGLGRPSYNPPTQNLTNVALSACTGPSRVIDFWPGVYTDLDALNSYTSGSGSCRDSILWFHPGAYYFDLSGTWRIRSGYVVGGMIPPSRPELNIDSPPVMPGSCWTPIPPDGSTNWPQPPANAGVEFVLGGTSRIRMDDAHVELCGTYHTNSPPITLYALDTSVGSAPGPVLPAQPDQLCANEISGTDPRNNADTCAVLYTNNSPHSQLYIQGTTFMPKAWVQVQINNDSSEVFRFGVITRKLTLFAPASAVLDNPVIEVPDLVNAGPSRTVLYLAVFVCPGTTPCSTSGNPQLKVKLGITDPDGTAQPGHRQVTVYDWSVQRN